MKESKAVSTEGKKIPRGRFIEYKQISIRLPEEMLAQIESFGKKEKRNRSNMIEWLLREALRQKGGGK